MFFKKLNFLIPALALVLFFAADISALAQVRQNNTETVLGTRRLDKDIPIRPGHRVTGNGLPTELYVIQLARFETMDRFPNEFPKGTFLLSSPDHPDEKVLFAGYYASLAEARQAVADWKKDPMFSGAFARPTPLIVRYD